MDILQSLTTGKPKMAEPLQLSQPEPQLNQPELFDYKQVKTMLESSIAFVENKPKNKVTLEDAFFVEADIRVVKKNRNRPRKRLLISEQDTSQENTTDEITTFHFRTSFEETTSVSLAATQGLTASLGGTLGGGGMGGNIGLSSGLQYSRSKSIGRDKSNAATKELTANVEVKPNTLVIVKELVYEVEWAAMCELELILRKEDKIKYKCKYGRRKEKVHLIEVNKLLQKAIQQRESKLGRQQRESDYEEASFRGVGVSVVPDISSTGPVPTYQIPPTTTDPSQQTHSVPVQPVYQNVSVGSVGTHLHSSPTVTYHQRLCGAIPVQFPQQRERSPTPTHPVPKPRSVPVQSPPPRERSPSPTYSVPNLCSVPVQSLQQSKRFHSVPNLRSVPVPSLRQGVSTVTRDAVMILLQSQSCVMPLALHHHVTLTENMIVITFLSDCLFNGEEHKLEIIKLSSDPARVKRIIDHQTGLSNQSNEEDMMLSLTKRVNI